MEEKDEPMARSAIPEADALLDQAIPVLDQGFVRLVDYMGGDARVVQSARVSYGEGTKTVREDKGLINYLMRHAHTSPFEQVELTFHVKAPIFVIRQWFRHRTACLAGDSLLYFNGSDNASTHSEPGQTIPMAEFHRLWHDGMTRADLRPTSRERLQQLPLRMCDEVSGEITSTRVVDIWETGVKPVFRVTLANGYALKMTEDHRCLTRDGWLTLRDATQLQHQTGQDIHWNAGAPALSVNGVLCEQLPSTAADKERGDLAPKLMRTYSPIVRIEFVGLEPTYDLEVAGPFHNFVANGFIVHNSVNEISARYSVMKEEFYQPTSDAVRAQSTVNKQVGEGALAEDVTARAIERLGDIQHASYEAYQALLEDGVARELARSVLSVGLYSEFYWKQNLHNLFHFLRLRMDWHAQAEIRAYAVVMADMARRVAPYCYEAFSEHVLNAQRFSGTEMEALRRMLAGESHGLEGRVAQEFEAKLAANHQGQGA
jgi:thymidylate synthase ThyX